MKHQFIGGPLAGKVKFLTSEDEAKQIPWEEYERRAEANGLIVWDHRSQVSTPVEVAAAVDTQVAYHPTQEPIEGGYPVVKSMIAGGRDKLLQQQFEVEREQKQRMIDSGTWIPPQGVVDRLGLVLPEGVVATTPDQPDASEALPGASDSLTRDALENGVQARIDVQPEVKIVHGDEAVPDDVVATIAEVEYGDPGTLPGEMDFKYERKRLGFPAWQWFKGQVVPNGSSSLGDSLEKGEVTDRQARALGKLVEGVNSAEDVYKLAENWVRAQAH